MKTPGFGSLSRARRGYCASIIALVLGIAAPNAYAQQQKIEDATAARALFDEARALASSGKYSEACPKFEESQRLAPGVGTQFNLADCFEHVGRTASAWTLFLNVASAAKAERQTERERIARQRAEALHPGLSKLSIVVASGAEVEGLDLQRDGSAVGRPLWGTAVPVDPGNHVVTATAPGHKPWRTSVQVKGDGGTLTVTVPVLDVQPAAVPGPAISRAVMPLPTQSAPRPAPQPIAAPQTRDQGTSRGGSTQKTIGLVVGGAGVVGLGVATFFGLSSKSKMDQSSDYCKSNGDCWDQRGLELRSDAVSKQTVAYITGGVGAAALIGGALIFLTAPSSSDMPKAANGPSASLAVGLGHLSIRGRF